MEEKKSRKAATKNGFMARWIAGLAVILAIGIAFNAALQIFKSYIDAYLGGDTYTINNPSGTEDWDTEYYSMDYTSSEAVAAAASDMVETLESEGIVLLKNNGVLPLSQDEAKVTLLGRDAADPVYGGSGSGSVDVSTAVNAKAGLENAGFEVNPIVYDILAAYAQDENHPRAKIAMDDPDSSTYYIGEMPAEGYTDDAIRSFDQYSDAAIIMIGRGGGEGGDLTRDMSGWDDHYIEGQHQLELNYDEKQMIELAKEHFEKVVVLLNLSTSMELGELEHDPDIDAIVFIGSPGQTGFNAVGKVLNGEVNPSGRTVDTWAADFTKDPSFVNFGRTSYSNMMEPTFVAGFGCHTDGNFFVQYEEGIYVGYRYYETAAVENFIDYDEAVVYPFGYGLSYTEFAWEIVDQRLGDVDGQIQVDVKVTNTGDVAGKDVIELYYSAPYTKGGIEKSSVVLGDFAKTRLLAPGESETLTLTFAVEDMASYDYKSARAYVLEAGDYVLTVQTDSHNIKDGTEPISYTVEQTITYSDENARSSDLSAATNQFDDVSAMFTDTATEGMALNMSRADFEGTFPTALTDADLVASEEIQNGFDFDLSQISSMEAEMPVTGVDHDLSLIDLRGLDYDDPKWDELLEQMSVKDYASLINNGSYSTPAVNSIAKPATIDLDGPAGISAYIGTTSCTAYPSEVIIASTWNQQLAYEMGVMVGNEGLASGTNGWYAPAMNTHRSPFAGRNFEYYSEDGVLAGKIGAQVVSGAMSKGMYCYVKHFALNDQESGRCDNAICVWANEQAIREIYLRPFEICIKNATTEIQYIADENGTVATREEGNLALMSSFNRIGTTWTGGSKALCTNVLRNEWNFQGMVITDFGMYSWMKPNQAIYAGTDLILIIEAFNPITDTSSAAAVSHMRNAVHNILYTVVNSNAVNGLAPGAAVQFHMATWRYAQIGIDVVLIVGFSALLVWGLKKKKQFA